MNKLSSVIESILFVSGKEVEESFIKEKLENLSVTLYNALQIIRKFSGILFVYALANIVLLMLELDYYVTCASIAILGAAFLYKLLEFLENKFCFIKQCLRKSGS